jgi:hypothetical protein
MCTSGRGLRSAHRMLGTAIVLLVFLAVPARWASADPDANTCNGVSEFGYPSAPNFSAVGDTIRIVLTIGASTIQGGTTLTIDRVRFNLDCNNSNLGLNCPDDGPVVSYQGNLISTCPSGFTSSHGAGDVLPNQVVFTPGSPIEIPAGATNFCTLAFDVRIETRSADGTPDVIEQVSGYDASLGDGVCNTTPPLAAGNTNSGSIRLCPICDDGNACNGTETCNADLGCLPGNPVVCNDNNVCTTDSCNPEIPAPNDPCVFVDNSARCNDNNVCTDDRCDPILDCQFTDNSARCNDNNVCTDDRCDPVLDCQHADNSARCDDQNVCTTDSCDPILGCVHVPTDTECNDNNVCTDDICDPVNGCQHTDNSARCNDNNACNTDACDPATGCTHTVVDCNDHNKCTNDVCSPETGCVFTPIICNDNNACTNDSCDPASGCVYTAIDCNDQNKCTNDSCDPATGCLHAPLNCDDSNACTTDTCDLASGCVNTHIDCNDQNSCTDDSCSPATGCSNTPIVCNDNNQCTNDSCDPASGCVYVAVDCNDQNKCTNDSCNPAKGCVHATLNCDDLNACTTDGCDPAGGCTHNTNDCNDQNKCTNDSCNSATGCVNTPVSCDDLNACTTDACDPASGCTHTTNDCNDQDKCTNDSCNPATGCVHTPFSCDDGNACTIDACDPAGGCTHTTINCDDHSLCTDDSCNATTGCQNLAINCDDQNFCTDDSCSPEVGCIHTPNNTPCEDGSVCNGHEACLHGACRHGVALDCNDDNPCTDDCCDAIQGCLHTTVQNCLPNVASPESAWNISAGHELPGGEIEVDAMATTVKGSFCGEIQADTGTVADPDFDHQIAGNWKHQRPQRKGELVALTYNSMVAGCDSVLDGELCPGSSTQVPGQVVSPASMGCFSGVGTYTLKNGRSKQVAFRVEVEDHGMPSANGANPGDIYRLRVWYPKNTETADGLAAAVSCSVRNPEQALRPANVSESASLTAGDLKISAGIR